MSIRHLFPIISTREERTICLLCPKHNDQHDIICPVLTGRIVEPMVARTWNVVQAPIPYSAPVPDVVPPQPSSITLLECAECGALVTDWQTHKSEHMQHVAQLIWIQRRTERLVRKPPVRRV